MFLNKKSHLAIMVFCFAFPPLGIKGMEDSIPTLAETIPARHAEKNISEEFLINLQEDLLHDPSLDWLGNDYILFEKTGVIEIFDVKKDAWISLGKGLNPKPSPDGEWIAYIDTNEKINQIWLMHKDGTQKRPLTFLQEGIRGSNGHHYDFAWSPDSKSLAYFINPVNPDQNIESLYLDLPPSTIKVIDLMNGSQHEIYSCFALIGDISWHPNGKILLMSKLRIGWQYNETETTSCVQAVRMADGYVRILAKFNGLQQGLRPQFSPDGQKISLLNCFENEKFNWLLSLGVMDYDDEGVSLPPLKQLTFDMKLCLSHWSKDGKSLFALRNYGPYNQIYNINLESGVVAQIANSQLSINQFSTSPDNQKLVALGYNPHGKQLIDIVKINGCHVENIRVTSPLNEQIAYSEVQEIEWESIDYPTKMRGLIFLPNNYQKGIRYPLIVDVHGGGAGASIHLLGGGGILLTSLEWQLWTAKGYAVFVPEMRSSAAFGWLAIARDDLQNHDLVNCDMKDILSGVDELVKRGIVDDNSLALIGHSAGARRANWMSVATNRFKAIVSKEGWVDEWLISLKHPQGWELFGGSPEEVPENYQKNSALFHVKGASTPTLFLMGNPTLGGCDVDQTVLELHHALKEKGIDTEYVKYEDEGHLFLLPKNRRDALHRTIEWIDRHTAKATPKNQ